MADVQAMDGVVEELLRDRKILQDKLQTLRDRVAEIEAERKAVEGQVDDLDITIRVLTKKQGKVPPEANATSEASATVGGRPEVVAAALTGKSWPQAAESILQAAGRPIKTADILKRLEEGGMQSSSARPYANLYSALSRSKRFKQTKRGWVLREWEAKPAPEK